MDRDEVTHIRRPGRRLEFYAYETMGAVVYNAWGMSEVPRWLKRPHDWRPFRFAEKPLLRLGVVRHVDEPGVTFMAPRPIAAVLFWRPFSRPAYWLWHRLGMPGYLARLKFTDFS
jgi:hypothetical protein